MDTASARGRACASSRNHDEAPGGAVVVAGVARHERKADALVAVPERHGLPAVHAASHAHGHSRRVPFAVERVGEDVRVPCGRLLGPHGDGPARSPR